MMTLMDIQIDSDNVRMLKILQSMSEFGGLWKHEDTACTLIDQGWVERLCCSQLAFLGEKQPAFSMGEIPIETTMCTKYTKTKQNTNISF